MTGRGRMTEPGVRRIVCNNEYTEETCQLLAIISERAATRGGVKGGEETDRGGRGSREVTRIMGFSKAR